jgi:hypothetical protein
MQPKILVLSATTEYFVKYKTLPRGRWSDFVAGGIRAVRNATSTARLIWIAETPHLPPAAFSCMNQTMGLPPRCEVIPSTATADLSVFNDKASNAPKVASVQTLDTSASYSKCSFALNDALSTHVLAGASTENENSVLQADGNAYRVDATRWICPPSPALAGPGRCNVCTAHGIGVFRDNHHLGNAFAESLDLLMTEVLTPHLQELSIGVDGVDQF